MREGQTAVTRRQDYAPPAFWIDSVELTIDLDPAKTRVLSRLRLRSFAGELDESDLQAVNARLER